MAIIVEGLNLTLIRYFRYSFHFKLTILANKGSLIKRVVYLWCPPLLTNNISRIKMKVSNHQDIILIFCLHRCLTLIVQGGVSYRTPSLISGHSGHKGTNIKQYFNGCYRYLTEKTAKNLYSY